MIQRSNVCHLDSVAVHLQKSNFVSFSLRKGLKLADSCKFPLKIIPLNIFASALQDGTSRRDSRNQRITQVQAVAVDSVPVTAHDHGTDLSFEIQRLEDLLGKLSTMETVRGKSSLLDSDKQVRSIFGNPEVSPMQRKGSPLYQAPIVELALNCLSEAELYHLKCLIASGQKDLIHVPFDWMDLETVESYSEPQIFSPSSSIKSALNSLGALIENWDREQSKNESPLLNEETLEADSVEDTYNSFVEGWQSPGIFHSQILQIIDFEGQCEFMEAGFLDAQQCDCPEVSDGFPSAYERLLKLVKLLGRLEKFYEPVGGIIGYQLESLRLIEALKESKGSVEGHLTEEGSFQRFSVPPGEDLSKNHERASQAAIWGLQGLGDMAEIFPLGGAGDRLGLMDEKTGECLPVAMLPYCGRTLLEGLIRDLQAREYLHFCLFGERHTTPVAIMTSAAKQNHERVQAVCESHGWFGRGRHNFKLFEQPLVPTVAAADGRWLASDPLTPVLKPGGHGVIWKLAQDEGVFEWFREKKRKAALLRQISNPFAATDVTMLALSGIGLHDNKKLGFASCDRNVGTAEGVNVLVEKRGGNGQWEYGITCIEYTEFDKLGIADVPVSPGSTRSQYPANTNILFVDLEAVETAATCSTPKASLPGLIMNLKKSVNFTDGKGNRHSVQAGRLECTMQNIADSLTDAFDSQLTEEDMGNLSTFLVYNNRRKVTSSAKRRRKPGDLSLHQTPDGSVLDLQRNAAELLTSCRVEMPLMENNQCYLSAPPPFMVLIHPAMGPLWDIVRQKIRGGSVAEGGEVQLEIAEFDWEDVHVTGSLQVLAENVMGRVKVDSGGEGILQYGEGCSRCRLRRVTVKNRGVDWENVSNVYWQHKLDRLEAMKVVLHEDAEFEAMDVTIEGSHLFEVPAGHKLTLTQGESGVEQSLEKLPVDSAGNALPSWKWLHSIANEKDIVLEVAS